jgi:hypothetical protein
MTNGFIESRETEISDTMIILGTMMVPGLGFSKSLTIRHFCLESEMKIGRMNR